MLRCGDGRLNTAQDSLTTVYIRREIVAHGNNTFWSSVNISEWGLLPIMEVYKHVGYARPMRVLPQQLTIDTGGFRGILYLSYGQKADGMKKENHLFYDLCSLSYIHYDLQPLEGVQGLLDSHENHTHLQKWE